MYDALENQMSESYNREAKTRRLADKILLFMLVVIILIWTLAPFAWLFITSISTQAKMLAIPIRWLPDPPTFEHYAAMFDLQNPTGALFLAAMRNSLIIALSTTAISLTAGVLAAYSLSRFIFPGRKTLIMGMMATRLLPTIALVIPFYVLIVGFIDPVLPMFDTRRNLIILYTSFSVGLVVWFMRGYFATIPTEMEEQAMVDGATRLQAFLQVVLPLATPGLFTTGLLVFLLSWDEFLLSLIFSRTTNAYTMPYFIFVVGSSQYYQSPAAVAAGGFIAALPPIILAFIFQNNLVKGLTAGAVKG